MQHSQTGIGLNPVKIFDLENSSSRFGTGPFFFHGFLRPISRAREIENDAFHGHFTG